MLKASIFMVQMVCRVATVLVSATDTILAFMADSRKEADAYQRAYLKLVGGRHVWTKLHHATDTFMPANMRQFDVSDWLAIWSCGCTSFGMEVCKILVAHNR